MHQLREWFIPAIRALKAYWPAVIALQAAAVAVAILYYQSGRFREIADQLMAWKLAGGVVFVVIANIISGAVIPESIKILLRPKGRPAPTLPDWFHLCVLMGVLGWMVNAFYAVQSRIFGDGPEFWRILIKMVFDQFGYSLFIAVPVILAWFAWRQQGYSFKRLRKVLNLEYFLKNVPPMFAPNVLFWSPALLGLYALPGDLQFLMFLFLNAAWCMIMIFIARELHTGEPAL